MPINVLENIAGTGASSPFDSGDAATALAAQAQELYLRQMQIQMPARLQLLNQQMQAQTALQDQTNAQQNYSQTGFTTGNAGTGYYGGVDTWFSSNPLQYTYMYGTPVAAFDNASVGGGKERVVEEPSRELLKRVAVAVDDAEPMDEERKLAIETESLLGYLPLRQALKAPGLLKRALAKLEIEILDQPSVNAYKAQMVEHYRTTNKMLAPTWRLTPLANYRQEVPKFALRKAVALKRELPEAEFYIDQLAIDPFLIVSLTELPDGAVNYERQLDAETAAYVEVWSEPKFEAEM